MHQLKILVIPGYRIFPIDSGGAHGQLTFLDKQQYQHSIEMITTPDNIAEGEFKNFNKRFPGIRLIPVGYKKLNAGEKIKAFIIRQYRKLSGRDIAYKLNKSRNINGFVLRDPFWVETIASIAMEGRYDLVQVEHAKNIGIIELLKGTSKKIFIHHEIYHTRVYQDLKSLRYSEQYATYISSIIEAAEIAWLNKYDGIITFNEEDTRMLIEKGVKTPQQVAQPFALFDDEFKNIYDPSLPPVLIFIGGEKHFPNKEGLQWFLKEIFPLVKTSVAEATVKVTGEWTSQFKASWSKDKQIIFTGFVDDINSVLKNAILIVPVRIGSGIRVKVFTSFAKGLPIVSTTLGASGIPGLVQEKNIILADDEVNFSNAITGLLLDPGKRKTLSENACQLAAKNFELNGFVTERNDFYEQILHSTR